ncbi:MAG TPA: hypothetical protein VJ900_00460 [Patescibacteria group bacterium]|nr:hypothetical protein [Patescibacteria group bacterium]
MEESNIQGYSVKHKSGLRKGIFHLDHILSTNETESIFRNARMSGSIKFEDRVGRNYVLKYKPFGKYTLKKR